MAQKGIVTCPSRKKVLVIDDVFYSSSYDFEVTAKDLEKAYEELNEKENERENCIRSLKEKLQNDRKYQYCTDDHYLLCYLRFRKFDVEKAYNTIHKAHSSRIKHPELFDLPPNLEQLCNTGFVSWLPYRDEEGRVILTYRFSKWNLEEMSLYEMLQYTNAVSDLALMNPHGQISGVVTIHDFKDLSTAQVNTVLNPTRIRVLVNMLQEFFPYRIKLVLLINCHSLLLSGFNVIKFFLKKKVVNRIKLLGSDVTEIHQYVNPALLPKEYGGTLEEEEYSLTGHTMDNLPYLRYIRSLKTTPA